MRPFWIILTLILILSPKVYTQDNSSKIKFKDGLHINTQIGRGLLIAHRSSLRPIVQDYPMHCMLEVAKKTYGNHAWQSLYNFPSLGIGYFHGTLGNNEILGKANALYGFIEAPYYPERRITILYKFGFGLAYLNKKFDLEENIYNSAIGSHINAFIHISFDAKMNIYKNRLFVKTGLGITHTSNGKTQTPNLGLNIIDWHLSLSYFLGPQAKPVFKPLKERKKHTFVAVVAGGYKEFTEPNLGKFFAGNATLEYEYAVMNKSSWGLGLDCFYDGVVKRELEMEQNANPSQNAIRMGLHLGFVYNYGKVGFIVQMGSYLAPYYTDDGSLYHRIGLRAKLNQHLMANLTMKTHWARADIVEFGLGYYFQK